jgi:hypothetical protein
MELPNIPNQTPANDPEKQAPEKDDSLKKEAPVQKETPASPPLPPKPEGGTTEEPKETIVPPKEETPPAVEQKKKSLVPSSILTKEAKTQLVFEKKETLRRVQLLKRIAFLSLVISLGWFFWLQMNLSETNAILGVVGVKQNMGQEIKQLKQDKMKLTLEEKKTEKEIEKITKKMEEGIYTLHSEEVQDIRSQQIQWFDEVDQNGEITFGMAGAIPRMQEYFNSRSYSDPDQILSGKHSDIEIENLQISREGVSFSVVASQILGKVFFLNIEFIEMVNSFPFLKNGTITQFARQKNAEEDDSMRFSVRLDRQLPGEKDPHDARFVEYTSWLKSHATPSL